MNKEIKELFNKYGVKDLKDKNGQSECYCCKNIKHKYSLTWTSFLYEYKEHYYCYDCLLMILLQKENERLYKGVEEYQKALDELMSEKMDLEHNWNELKKYIKKEIKEDKKLKKNWEEDIITYYVKRKGVDVVLDKMAELEEGGNNDNRT